MGPPFFPYTNKFYINSGRYYIYKERCESSDFSKVYDAVFKQLHVLAVGQSSSCFTLDQRPLLLFKHIHKNRCDNASCLK